jgi:hypothetical protein
LGIGGLGDWGVPEAENHCNGASELRLIGKHEQRFTGGTRDILGIGFEQTEGAVFRLTVFDDLKARGCHNILIAVADGLKVMRNALEVRPPRRRCSHAACERRDAEATVETSANGRWGTRLSEPGKIVAHSLAAGDTPLPNPSIPQSLHPSIPQSPNQILNPHSPILNNSCAVQCPP